MIYGARTKRAKDQDEPWAHLTCLTHPFHNPEAASLLTLAEQPRGHIMGQLQEAGGAGPAVFSYLAGCTLPAAHTLPGMGGARSQTQEGCI